MGDDPDQVPSSSKSLCSKVGTEKSTGRYIYCKGESQLVGKQLIFSSSNLL
jgi:hypothetical protein